MSDEVKGKIKKIVADHLGIEEEKKIRETRLLKIGSRIDEAQRLKEQEQRLKEK